MQGADEKSGGAPEPVRIRPAVPDDAAAICQIHKASVCTLCAPAYSPEEIEAWVGRVSPDDYRRLLSESDETLFVAEREQEVVGFSGLHGNEVSAVFVDPERGRGAGAPLLEIVEETARKRGVRRLHLASTLTAFPFYLAHGYEEQGRASMIRSGLALLVVEMTKILLSG